MHSTYPDIFYWLAAIHLKGFGPVKIRRCLEHLGDIKSLFILSKEELESMGLKEKYIDEIQTIHWKTIEKDFMWCEKNACHLISYHDKNYPKLLREIADAPPLLFIQGNPELLSKAQLAIVGSRNPTLLGRNAAEEFAYCLAQTGLTITSGLALGVDAASHKGALNAVGKTIAVMGAGLQHVYPHSHQKLADEIINKGALISEFLPNTRPLAKNFPMRNRIISGLSLGVLIIEAALQSGSLITARTAIEQGREVFALPGSIHNPLARGCHQLIRQGAKLVETASDILEELGSLKAVGTRISRKPIDLDTCHQQLLMQIGYEITALDAIIMQSGLTAGEVSSMLVTLELEGYATAVTGGYIRNL